MAKQPPGKKAARPPKRPPARQADAAKPLAPKVLRFIDEYMIDMNGSAAYRRAGYKATGNSAEVNARRLLRNARVALQIARSQAKTAEKLEITREDALREAWSIVKADARDLVEYRRFACPECYGASDGKETRDPLPGCKACAGEGRPDVIFKDTRKLSRQATALFAGVKITKDGIEVKMHSKLDALEKIFKHLGLYAADKKLEVTGAGGGPVAHAVLFMSDDELLAVASRGAQKRAA